MDTLIRLYPSTEISFETNGLGSLSESLEATVTEEKNGIFELNLVYPVTGRRFSDLSLGKIITAKTNPYDSKYQPFRIYGISKPIDGHVTVSAQHISYDLLGHIVRPFNTTSWRVSEDGEEPKENGKIFKLYYGTIFVNGQRAGQELSTDQDALTFDDPGDGEVYICGDCYVSNDTVSVRRLAKSKITRITSSYAGVDYIPVVRRASDDAPEALGFYNKAAGKDISEEDKFVAIPNGIRSENKGKDRLGLLSPYDTLEYIYVNGDDSDGAPSKNAIHLGLHPSSNLDLEVQTIDGFEGATASTKYATLFGYSHLPDEDYEDGLYFSINNGDGDVGPYFNYKNFTNKVWSLPPVIYDDDVLSVLMGIGSTSGYAGYLSGIEKEAIGYTESTPYKRPFNFKISTRSGGSGFPKNSEHFAVQEPMSIRSILGEGEESILGIYGGELEFDGFNVILWDERGYNKGTQIRYGKNMTNIECQESVATCYTGIYPYYKYNSNGYTTVYIIDKDRDGKPCSPIIPIGTEGGGYYDPPFANVGSNVLPLDLSSKDLGGASPTADILRTFADAYISANKLGQPAYTITVEYQPMSDSPEYAAYKAVEQVKLCDWVSVINEKLGVNNLAEVVKIEYDVLRNRYTQVDLTVNTELTSLDKTLAKTRKKSNDSASVDESLRNQGDAYTQATSDEDRLIIAEEAIEENRGDISTAQETAENASARADEAYDAADNAGQAAASAQITADDAQSTANEASITAENASARADEAYIAADNAGQAAASAQSTADDAQSTASDAQTKANMSIVRTRTLYARATPVSKRTVLDPNYDELEWVELSEDFYYKSLTIVGYPDLNLIVETVDGFSSYDGSNIETLFGYSPSDSAFNNYMSLNNHVGGKYNYGSKINQNWHMTTGDKTFEVLDGDLYVNGSKRIDVSADEFTGTSYGALYFGADNNNGTTRRYSKSKIKRIYAKSLTGGFEYDYYPVYYADNEQYALYDIKHNRVRSATITPEFTPDHGNVVPFESGPDIPPSPSQQWTIPSEYADIWFTEPPAPMDKQCYYTCVEAQYGDGHVEYFGPIKDEGSQVLLSWCKTTDTVQIDGGMIAANTVAADKIIANSLSANAITTGVFASQNFITSGGTEGMAMNLNSGTIISNGGVFSVDQNGAMTCTNANVAGNINSTTGRLGIFRIRPYVKEGTQELVGGGIYYVGSDETQARDLLHNATARMDVNGGTSVLLLENGDPGMLSDDDELISTELNASATRIDKPYGFRQSYFLNQELISSVSLGFDGLSAYSAPGQPKFKIVNCNVTIEANDSSYTKTLEEWLELINDKLGLV